MKTAVRLGPIAHLRRAKFGFIAYLATIYHPEWVGCSKFMNFFCMVLRIF